MRAISTPEGFYFPCTCGRHGVEVRDGRIVSPRKHDKQIHHASASFNDCAYEYLLRAKPEQIESLQELINEEWLRRAKIAA